MKSGFSKYNVLLTVILSFCLVFGCKDDENPNQDRHPQVTIESPINDGIYVSGEDINLKLSIAQDVEILNYRVFIRNTNTDELLFVKSEFTNTTLVSIDTIIRIETPEQAIMNIEVKAEDSRGNQIDETVSTFTLLPPQGNKLSLNFNVKYNGETLLMNKEYIYPSGERFEFTRFDMYISELAITNSSSTVDLKDIDFLVMTNTYRDISTAEEGFTYTIPGLDDGIFNQLRFNIGLTPEQNSTTPSAYPVSHPLGRANEYWDSGWASYIFASIEGRLDKDTSDPNLEQGIALHLGSDDAFQNISLTREIELQGDNETIVNIEIELSDLFINEDGEIYDILTTPSTHSLSDIPKVIELAENLKNSIKN